MYKTIIAVALLIVIALAFLNLKPKYDELEIRLGMSGPFSGNLAPLGEDLYLGANTYFRYIKEEGGLYGRTFRLINKDDKYEPKITAENVEALIRKYDVYALLGIVGTPTSKVALPIAKKYEVPFIGAYSGAQFLREEPRDPLILNGRTSYKKEVDKIIEYFVDEKHFTKIGVFYQNDVYGRSGLKAVKEALREKNMEITAEGSYKRNTLSVGHALYEISQKNPQGIVMVGATKPTAEFIKRARMGKKLEGATYAAISFSGSDMLVNELQKRVDNVIFSQVVPSPWTSSSKEVELYRELMHRYNPPKEYSYASLEGYFIARMTVELFRRVGKEFDKDDFIEEMENLYESIKSNQKVKESKRICKCLNNVYLTRYEDGKFWDIHGETQ